MAAIFEASKADMNAGLKDALRKDDPNWSVLRAKARVAPPGDAAIAAWHDLLFKTARLCGLDTSAWRAKKPSRAALVSAAAQLGRGPATKRSRSPSPGPANAGGGSAAAAAPPAKKPSRPAVQLCPTITSKPFRTITHSPDTCPWLAVQAQLRKTMPTATVTELCSWDRPQDAVFDAAGLQPTLSATKWVWHGSAASGVYDSIVGNGFQPQLSGSTTGEIYGHGTYFARDAKYSHDYAYRPGGSSDPRRKLLLCSIRPGESCRGVQGMKLAPLKPGRTDGERFDSFVNDVANPSIYVIQHQHQMRPLYEVTYTV